MSELILHHYAGSPFSEKVRAIFGYKHLAWSSVEISPIMPRPLLMPLSGGYRRTPIVQYGADIFCDTHIITEFLDLLKPEPALHPETAAWTVRAAAQRWDTAVFAAVVTLCFQPAAVAPMLAAIGEEVAAKFAEDRVQLAGDGPGVSALAPEAAEAILIDELALLEAQLASGDWLVGATPTLADFSVYHCLWFLRNNEVVAPMLLPFARVRDWIARIQGFGHGERTEMDAEAALAIGRDAQPMSLEIASGHLPTGISLEDAVTVSAIDYGMNPISGRLDYCTAHACSVLREDEEAGALRVHFPRSGFRIDAA